MPIVLTQSEFTRLKAEGKVPAGNITVVPDTFVTAAAKTRSVTVGFSETGQPIKREVFTGERLTQSEFTRRKAAGTLPKDFVVTTQKGFVPSIPTPVEKRLTVEVTPGIPKVTPTIVTPRLIRKEEPKPTFRETETFVAGELTPTGQAAVIEQRAKVRAVTIQQEGSRVIAALRQTESDLKRLDPNTQITINGKTTTAGEGLKTVQRSIRKTQEIKKKARRLEIIKKEVPSKTGFPSLEVKEAREILIPARRPIGVISGKPIVSKFEEPIGISRQFRKVAEILEEQKVGKGEVAFLFGIPAETARIAAGAVGRFEEILQTPTKIDIAIKEQVFGDILGTEAKRRIAAQKETLGLIETIIPVTPGEKLGRGIAEAAITFKTVEFIAKGIAELPFTLGKSIFTTDITQELKFKRSPLEARLVGTVKGEAIVTEKVQLPLLGQFERQITVPIEAIATVTPAQPAITFEVGEPSLFPETKEFAIGLERRFVSARFGFAPTPGAEFAPEGFTLTEVLGRRGVPRVIGAARPVTVTLGTEELITGFRTTVVRDQPLPFFGGELDFTRAGVTGIKRVPIITTRGVTISGLATEAFGFGDDIAFRFTGLTRKVTPTIFKTRGALAEVTGEGLLVTERIGAVGAKTTVVNLDKIQMDLVAGFKAAGRGAGTVLTDLKKQFLLARLDQEIQAVSAVTAAKGAAKATRVAARGEPGLLSGALFTGGVVSAKVFEQQQFITTFPKTVFKQPDIIITQIPVITSRKLQTGIITSQKQLRIPKVKEIERVKTISAQNLLQQTITSPFNLLAPKVTTRAAERVTAKERVVQIPAIGEIPALDQLAPTVTVTTPTTLFAPVTPLPPVGVIGLFGGLVPPLPKGKIKLKKEGYHALVRNDATRRSKFIQVNKQPLTKQQALGLGAQIVDQSVSRTFKIKKAKKAAVPRPELNRAWANLKRKFRKPIRKGKPIPAARFIEKSRHAIDSRGELQGITVKGLLARRRRRF